MKFGVFSIRVDHEYTSTPNVALIGDEGGYSSPQIFEHLVKYRGIAVIFASQRQQYTTIKEQIWRGTAHCVGTLAHAKFHPDYRY